MGPLGLTISNYSLTISNLATNSMISNTKINNYKNKKHTNNTNQRKKNENNAIKGGPAVVILTKKNKNDCEMRFKWANRIDSSG